MLRIINLIGLSAFIILCLTQCTPDKNWKAETVEIYTVLAGEKKYSKDKLSYKEINYLNPKGLKVETHYFEKDESFKAKEVFSYNEKDLLEGSKYYDAEGTLLSFYTFQYENEDQPNMKMAYEGSSEELLRIERYKYDDKGNRITKEILDHNSVLNRTYGFNFDGFGNEILMVVLDSLNNEIFTESYSVTRKDVDGKLLQCWGLIDDVPRTVKYRSYEKIINPKL